MQSARRRLVFIPRILLDCREKSPRFIFQSPYLDVCLQTFGSDHFTEGNSVRKTLLVSSLALATTIAAPFAFATPGSVRCGKLLDVRSGRMLTDQIIVYDANGTITAVDLLNATCLPGLIDVHTHLAGDPSNSGYQVRVLEGVKFVMKNGAVVRNDFTAK